MFFLRELAGLNTDALGRAGFKFRTIPAEASIETELAMIAECSPTWLVVDHYELGFEWEARAKKFAKIFVIDDLFNRTHNCDALLDQNFRLNYDGLYQGLVPAHCRIYLGPAFSLLPISYTRAETRKAFSTGSRKDVLVFFGGGDPAGEALKFYDALAEAKGSCYYTLVVTSSHRSLPELQKLKNTGNCTLRISPDNWVELLQQADFFFGSCGSVTWERFFFGLPGAVVTVAENQEKIAQDLHLAGLGTHYGKALTLDYRKILPAIEKEAQDDSRLKEMSEKIKRLTRRFPGEELHSLFGAPKERIV